MILVDTSVWIDYFNNYSSVEADYLTLCIAEVRPVVLAGLVLTETLLGLRNSAQADSVTRALSSFDLAPELARPDYEGAAAIYRACRDCGTTPRSTIDCLLAQLCLRHDYELLSRDRDFEMIARVFPLKRVAPGPGVHEQARVYYTPGGEPTRRRASVSRRSASRVSPAEQLRALGGKVSAAPDESVIKEEDFEATRRPQVDNREHAAARNAAESPRVNRRRAAAPRRSSRA